MPEFATELQAALSAVQQASKFCRKVQKSVTPEVLEKRDQSPVTIADFGSQAMICRTMGSTFPQDRIIAEEDSSALRWPENAEFVKSICAHFHDMEIEANFNDVFGWIDRGTATQFSSRFWSLDPIDGTKGFLRKGQYAVSLALIIDGRVEVGVLGCPSFPFATESSQDLQSLLQGQSGGRTDADADASSSGTLFYAVRGQGAFARPLDYDAAPRPIRVSATTDPALARFCESVESAHSSHSESALVAEKLGLTATAIRMDSQAKYATVACGIADVYLRLPSKTGYFEKIWDHAGGVAVIEAAGGRVTDINGKSLDFSRGRDLNQNRGVIVTNGRLHDETLVAVQTVIAAESSNS